jgi:hypothetical protein
MQDDHNLLTVRKLTFVLYKSRLMYPTKSARIYEKNTRQKIDVSWEIAKAKPMEKYSASAWISFLFVHE